jgi:uncharacterized membrane protein
VRVGGENVTASSDDKRGLEEGLAEGISRRRILSLSDIVFGLALSIGALTLIGHQPSTTTQFVFSLGQYGFSFLILISVWRAYSRITSLLPTESGALVQLNVVLLFIVSIEPYLFNELFVASGGLLQSVSGVFGIDIASMFSILAFFSDTIATEERHLVPSSSLRRYKFERNRDLAVGLIFAASVVPYFGQTLAVAFTSGGSTTDWSVRNVMWLVALLIGYSSTAIRVLTGRDDTLAREKGKRP